MMTGLPPSAKQANYQQEYAGEGALSWSPWVGFGGVHKLLELATGFV